jgi:hypothetical protein
MRIQAVKPLAHAKLHIIADDGRIGIFNLTPYLHYEAFVELQDAEALAQVTNGGYFIEWASGADLSADTIEAHWQPV